MIAFLSNVSKTFTGRNKLSMSWHVRRSMKFIFVKDHLSNLVELVWSCCCPGLATVGCGSASCYTAMNLLKTRKKHFNDVDNV